ncbi:MAG: TetR/AcrR family transcriptional regulator [Marinilabiliaceae bacterium]|nr:TetR/AcrR family transcriptional regulator [Marinilabiliaceae bacterium]
MTDKDEIVKDEIISRAQELFQQYGMKKTTMDEIAAASGKAKSTLYHYFKSKDEVFDEVITKEMRNLRKIIKDKVDDHKSMVDKLSTYAREYYSEVINKVNVYRILKKETQAERKHAILFNRMMDFEKAYIIRILEDGLDSGEYTRIERNDIETAAEMFLAAFYGLMLYSIEKEGFIDQFKIQNMISMLIPKVFS